jgi:glutamine amidotransferase-like uncharacterized protein
MRKLWNIILFPILFLILIMIIFSRDSPGFKSKIALFAGSGAVLAKDVGVALEELDIQYEKINENIIKEGRLQDFEILIIPGGYTETIIEALGGESFEKIREFVRRGGKYIGICAGAYLAPKIVKLRFGRNEPGLDIINVENKREAGIGLKEIEILNENHPLAKGYRGKIKIWYQNGPFMKAGTKVEVIAKYNEDFAAIVASNYGKGKVILFSPHPEGSLENKIDPEEIGTLNLLKNAIDW